MYRHRHLFLFLFLPHPQESSLCSQPARGKVRRTRRIFPEHVERSILDPEHSFVADLNDVWKKRVGRSSAGCSRVMVLDRMRRIDQNKRLEVSGWKTKESNTGRRTEKGPIHNLYSLITPPLCRVALSPTAQPVSLLQRHCDCACQRVQKEADVSPSSGRAA